MGGRVRDSGRTIDAFADRFLVRCPRCGGRADVAPRDAPARDGRPPELWYRRMRLVCPACGRTDDWEPPPHAVGAGFRGRVEFVSGGAKRHADKTLIIGAPMDWYFHLPLWLQTPCCGSVLWAYNERHLDAIAEFVAATLREPVLGPMHGYRSLHSRLPRWIKDAKNRDDVLRCVARLRTTL